MKPLTGNNCVRAGSARVVLNLICALLLSGISGTALAQTRIIRGGPMPDMPAMPSPGGSDAKPDSGGKSGGGPWIPSEPLNGTSTGTNKDDVELSFQNANIDMVVQWLAQTTGKTVVKPQQVQCQLTITSSKKVSQREAINIVYRALALEGYTVIESSKSILIVPEGKEPRMTPEVVDNSQKGIPEGRERLTKVFSLNHVQAATLKEKVQTALSDKATVTLDDHANQIIISDYNDNLRVAAELIQALDTDRPQDVAVRILTLKHMSAPDLAKELAPLYQKISGRSSESTIDVAADERANSLIVLSGAADYNALQNIISVLDTDEAQEKVMRTFPLKNADAEDVAKQLQDLGQDQQNNRYPYYIFYGGSSPASGKKMNVVADRRRNAVIVQAPPAAMDGVEKMIKELDAPVADDSLAPRIYKLKYVSAVDMEDVLNELFLKKQSPNYLDYIFGYGGDESQENNQDAGRLYGKVRITSEPYSNAILVTSNSKENLAVVEDVLQQLDQPSEGSESTLHVSLMYAQASTVARNLNILFAKNGSPPLRPSAQQQQNNNNNNNGYNGQQQPQQSDSTQSSFALEQDIKEEAYYPWLGGQPDTGGRGATGNRDNLRPVSDLVGRVRVVADESGNALLVSANVHYLPSVLKLINEMDAPSDQVLIEARIIEVSSDYLDKLGVRWSPNGAQEFTGNDLDNSILATGSGSYSKGFGGTTTVNQNNSQIGSTLSPANLMAQIRSGVVSSTVNIDFLVQFLRETTDATVIGDPQINIRDNDTGRLFVGQQVPVLNASVNPALGGNSQNYYYKDVGVILEVIPHINSSGDVNLKIRAESSTTAPGQTFFGGAVFNTRNFQTELTAKNGQTLVLGGIIQKQITDTLRKTPVLGSIPGLKWLFNKKDKETQEVELMVFLHPRVIHSGVDAQNVLNEINRNSPKVQKWEHDSQPKK